jgi:hypothetical protein
MSGSSDFTPPKHLKRIFQSPAYGGVHSWLFSGTDGARAGDWCAAKHSDRLVIQIHNPENLKNEPAFTLLKMMDNPPRGVVFVLTSDEPQKVPPTIRARAQHVEVNHV